MAPIKIRKKDTKDWNALDFVRFFKERYETKYEQPLEINFVKDCSIMKRIITAFKKADRPKNTIVRFIDWVFDTYSARKDFTTPLTIGFLPYWINDYLQTDAFSKKKKKKDPVVLSDEMQQWLAEQRKTYKKDSHGSV